MFLLDLYTGANVLESKPMIWLEATLSVQPTSLRVNAGNNDVLTATVFIHIDQAVQDTCAVSSPSEDSGELKEVQDDGFSNITPCAVCY